MIIYLDDDSTSYALQQQLILAGHLLVLPAQVGLSGHSDPEHLTYAITHQLPLLTRNYQDFRQLHNLIQTSGGNHPGILVVRKDNDSRDMKPYQVVSALTKMQTAHATCTDQYLILNHWR